MFITEQNTNQWTQIIKENLGVTDQTKLSWMAEYAACHEIKESLSLGVNATPAGGQTVIPANGVGPMYATPLNTTGMGNPMAPQQLSTTSTAPAEFFGQTPGSGDIPVSTLPMALNIALMTVGFDLVPVIPAKGPWTLLNYMDFPYAGGKIGRNNEITGIDGVGEGRENKPLYFKVLVPSEILAAVNTACKGKENEAIVITGVNGGVINGFFKTIGRMDGGIICEVKDVKNGAGADAKDTSLKAVFAEGLRSITIGGEPIAADETEALKKATVDFAQTQVDFVDGFANFATGKKESMTRAQNETGTGNTLGLRLFSKWVQMGSYEVTGQVTRQQLQDLPLYGVDAVATVMEAMQNEISQSINARILEYIRALGVTNAVKAKAAGIDLNLWIGKTPTTLDQMTKSFVDVNGVNHATDKWAVKNAETNSSFENLSTRQRRISSRILAASQYIAITGRRGKATHAVVSAQIAAALIDNTGYVISPMANTMSQTNQGLYKAGTLAGVEIYVDPYMDWNDTTITVFRKTSGKEPGLVFMPYILADTVSITAEGTMAPKMLVNSRYALVPVGFFPESQFFSFVVGSPEFGII